jgi:hypothetical protein
MLERITNSELADKIMLLFPVLATRIDSAELKTLANAYAMRSDIPIDSRIDYRNHTCLLAPFLSERELQN